MSGRFGHFPPTLKFTPELLNQYEQYNNQHLPEEDQDLEISRLQRLNQTLGYEVSEHNRFMILTHKPLARRLMITNLATGDPTHLAAQLQAQYGRYTSIYQFALQNVSKSMPFDVVIINMNTNVYTVVQQIPPTTMFTLIGKVLSADGGTLYVKIPPLINKKGFKEISEADKQIRDNFFKTLNPLARRVQMTDEEILKTATGKHDSRAANTMGNLFQTVAGAVTSVTTGNPSALIPTVAGTVGLVQRGGPGVREDIHHGVSRIQEGFQNLISRAMRAVGSLAGFSATLPAHFVDSATRSFRDNFPNIQPAQNDPINISLINQIIAVVAISRDIVYNPDELVEFGESDSVKDFIVAAGTGGALAGPIGAIVGASAGLIGSSISKVISGKSLSKHIENLAEKLEPSFRKSFREKMNNPKFLKFVSEKASKTQSTLTIEQQNRISLFFTRDFSTISESRKFLYENLHPGLTTEEVVQKKVLDLIISGVRSTGVSPVAAIASDSKTLNEHLLTLENMVNLGGGRMTFEELQRKRKRDSGTSFTGQQNKRPRHTEFDVPEDPQELPQNPNNPNQLPRARKDEL